MLGLAKYTKIQGYQIRAGVYVPVPPLFSSSDFPSEVFFGAKVAQLEIEFQQLEDSDWIPLSAE